MGNAQHAQLYPGFAALVTPPLLAPITAGAGRGVCLFLRRLCFFPLFLAVCGRVALFMVSFSVFSVLTGRLPFPLFFFSHGP